MTSIITVNSGFSTLKVFRLSVVFLPNNCSSLTNSSNLNYPTSQKLELLSSRCHSDLWSRCRSGQDANLPLWFMLSLVLDLLIHVNVNYFQLFMTSTNYLEVREFFYTFLKPLTVFGMTV